MKDYIDVLREALKDPMLKGIKCFRRAELPKLKSELNKHPGAEYLSEWKYEFVDIKYEYYVHSKDLGRKLEKLIKEGKTSRHPKLNRVYKVDQIEELLADPVISGSS